MRPPSPSLPEKEFLISALHQSLRIDGRELLESRPLELSFGPELGWVECALGKTRVIAYVDAKMVKPAPERPFEGTITIHSEISAMAGPEYEPGRPSEEEIAMSRMLDKVLRRSDAIDKESLCILAGQRVWALKITIHCLSDSGNMLDCACLAGIVALRHFRRPDVEVIGDEVTIHAPTERAPVPLSLHHSPYCLSFAFFPSSTPGPKATPVIVLDPTHLEQTLSHGIMSLALNAQREVCVLHKAGGIPVPPDVILFILRHAAVRAKELDALVKDVLAKDWAGRTVEVR